MDQTAASGGVERLETAIRRLEAALATKSAPGDGGDLRTRYDALVAQVEGAVQGLDQLLNGLV